MESNNEKIKSINTEGFEILEKDKEYTYQKLLTDKLDEFDGEFDQNTINEIVLWKINRYAKIKESTLKLLNDLPQNFDEQKTREVLKELIETKGIQLAMASTILRFQNPKIYQIIDQRVYRMVYGIPLSISSSKSETNKDAQVDLYLSYLKELKRVSEKIKIDFELLDRVLYMADKRMNKKFKIKY